MPSPGWTPSPAAPTLQDLCSPNSLGEGRGHMHGRQYFTGALDDQTRLAVVSDGLNDGERKAPDAEQIGADVLVTKSQEFILDNMTRPLGLGHLARATASSRSGNRSARIMVPKS